MPAGIILELAVNEDVSISSFLSNFCEIQWMPQSKQEKINGDFFEARKKTGLPVILWNSVAVDLS